MTPANRFETTRALLLVAALASCKDDASRASPDDGAADAGVGADATAPRAPLTDEQLRSFTGTYRAHDPLSGACAGTTYDFTGYEPIAAGTYPVFVYTVGTNLGNPGTAWDSVESRMIAREMARRGVIAVSVGYDNGAIPLSCVELDVRAACIYGDAPDSAMRALCSRTGADCAKGVAVSGESQGAIVALRSQNFHVAGGIKGAWVRSTVDLPLFSECVNASGTRQLPNARVWATNGASDTTPGTDLVTLHRVTGWPDDSVTYREADAEHGGYFQVHDSDLQPGNIGGADHTFHRYTDGSHAAFDWDANWAPPATTPWSLNARLDWLASLLAR